MIMALPIRYDNNRIDKILLKKYFKEIESVLNNIHGLSEINDYRKRFETEFAKKFSLKNTLAVNSGTDAMQLALLSLGIGKGDSVIMPALTYISAPLVTKYVGADVVLVDVKKDDLTIDEEQVEKAVTDNTKAIFAVHMFGHACEMDSLVQIAKKHNLYLIEDCCQAIGSRYAGKFLGVFGNFSAFSFSYYKPFAALGGSGGGMVVFKDDEYKEQLKKYIEISGGKEQLLELGKKFRKMQLIEIASSKIKLKYSKVIFESREKAKKIYEKGLEKVKGIKIFKDLEGRESVQDNYLILCDNRDKLHEHLKKHGIYCQLPYTPAYSMEIHNEEPKNVTEDYFKRGLHLPLFTFMKEEEVKLIIRLVKKFFEQNTK